MEIPQDLERVPAKRARDGIAGPSRLATAVLVGEPGAPALIAEWLKRVIDVVLAGIAIILLSAVMIVIAASVRATSPGPALFRQVRVGQHRRRFVMLKFRTMYRGNDDAAHRAYVAELLTNEEAPDGGKPGIYKLVRDPRVTPLGAVLRRTSLDELPQLFNVLLGHMSLVGPRPVLPWEIDLFGAEHGVRFSVKPGITGLWQVSGRSSLPMSRALDLDAEYVSRRSLALDLRIMAKTIPAVIVGRGAT